MPDSIPNTPGMHDSGTHENYCAGHWRCYNEVQVSREVKKQVKVGEVKVSKQSKSR